MAVPMMILKRKDESAIRGTCVKVVQKKMTEGEDEAVWSIILGFSLWDKISTLMYYNTRNRNAQLKERPVYYLTTLVSDRRTEKMTHPSNVCLQTLRNDIRISSVILGHQWETLNDGTWVELKFCKATRKISAKCSSINVVIRRRDLRLVMMMVVATWWGLHGSIVRPSIRELPAVQIVGIQWWHGMTPNQLPKPMLADLGSGTQKIVRRKETGKAARQNKKTRALKMPDMLSKVSLKSWMKCTRWKERMRGKTPACCVSMGYLKLRLLSKQ